MIYLCSKCVCSVFDGKTITEISPYIFYELTNIKDENLIIFGGNGQTPICINPYTILNVDKPCSNVEKCKINSNTFLFLNLEKVLPCVSFSLKCGNKDVCVCISSEVIIFLNGQMILNKPLKTKIEFSHYETMGSVVILYFKGETNFVVIIENEQVKFAEFYQEFNNEKEEKYFMAKKFDILNHGHVARVKNNEVETYLVYLDNNELKMQNEFVFLVFLDCYISGNFSYCNNLLCEEIKQKNAKDISNFFGEFDEYIPFKDYAFTFKKNTLAGVYKFEVINKQISNIIHLTPFC